MLRPRSSSRGFLFGTGKPRKGDMSRRGTERKRARKDSSKRSRSVPTAVPNRRTTSTFASTVSLWMRTVEADIQSRFSPILKRNTKIGLSWLRGDGRGYEIIIARAEEHHSGTDLAPSRLLKLDPNQDHFTRPDRHQLIVRTPNRQRNTQIQTGAVLRSATQPHHRSRPVGLRLQAALRRESARRFRAERRFARWM